MTPDIIAALAAKAAEEWRIPCSKNPNDDSLCKPKDDCVWGYEQGYLAALTTSPAGQEVRAPTIGSGEGVIPDDVLDRIIDEPSPADDDAAFMTVWLQLEARGYLWSEGNVEKAHLGWLLARALSSVEPAGNGREAVENAFIAGWEAQKAGRSFAAAMNDHIPALSSPPAADQEAVKCKRCNDTGWTIGNGTVREGCLSCDAQINMVRATPPAPALDGVRISREFYEFLLGKGHIDGTWFGDSHDTMRGKFWWRTLLRSFGAALPSPSEGESATVSREGGK